MLSASPPRLDGQEVLTFIAHMKVVSGKGPELQILLAHVGEQSRANEPGVMHYDFAISADDPNQYLVVEVYRDEAAQASHVQTAWVREAISKTMPLIESIDIKQYVSPGTRPIIMQLPGEFA
jgi:quinol monooxygenase YgiN